MPIIEKFMRSLRHLGGAAPGDASVLSLEEIWPRILPKVRPRFHYDHHRARGGGEGPEVRPLAGTFAQSLVVDLPGRDLDVDRGRLDAWGMDFDSLMLRARTNLLARGGEEGFERTRHGFHRSTWEDDLAGSRILLPGVLRRLRVEGDPVVLLPCREALLVAGTGDPRSLCLALEGALQLMDQDARPLNACPLRLEGFRWEPFEVPDDHPAAPLLARARRGRLLEEYGHQKALLDRLHRREGRRIAVAPFHLGRAPSGTMASFTLWCGGAGEGWLPEADRVCLAASAGTDGLWLPWDTVVRRLGHFLEPLGLFPERHRFRAFPDRGLLEDLAREGREAGAFAA